MTSRRRRGFTLMELMVVITIIALLGTIVIPSLINIFNSGADAQAYAVLSGQLAAARALAMKTSCYTLVHIQQADASIGGSDREKFFSAVMIRSPFTHRFNLDLVHFVGKVGGYSGGSPSSLTDNTGDGNPVNKPSTWVRNQWAGYSVRILSGNAIGATSLVDSSDGLRLTLKRKLEITKANGNTSSAAGGDMYMIYQPTGQGDPVALPAGLAFGQLSYPFVTTDTNGNLNYDGAALAGSSTSSDPKKDTNSLKAALFTTVNILFSPAGMVVNCVGDSASLPPSNSLPAGVSTSDGMKIFFDLYLYNPNGSEFGRMPGPFYEDKENHPESKFQVWSLREPTEWADLSLGGNACACRLTTPQYGTNAVVLFDFTKYVKLNDGAGGTISRQQFLDQGGQYLPLNNYTGQLLPRR